MAMEYFLKQINPANSTPLKICLDTQEVTVGRRSIVSLNGFHKVSRKHAKFSNRNGRWFVQDLESLNKLYVNFKEVNTDWVPLEIGDIIGFGTPSYIEDGGLVCVFAARNCIKQETFHEIQSPNIGTKNKETVQNVSKIKDSKSLPIKQELSPSHNGDSQKKTAAPKPECKFQTNVSSPSSSMLSSDVKDIPMKSSDIYDPSNVIAFQNKYESSKESKPIIKTEPIETSDGGLLRVTKTPLTKNLSVNQNLNAENINKYNNSENTHTSESKVSLKNNIEEGNEICKDEPSKARNVLFNEHCKEVDKTSFNDKKILKSSEKIQRTKDMQEEKKANILLTDCSKNVVGKNSLYDSISEEKMQSSNKLLAVIEKTEDTKPSQMTECSVNLVRCDSKYFHLSPEINSSKLFKPEDEDAKRIQRNSPEIMRSLISERHLKRKKFKERVEKNNKTTKVSLNLKVSKNRILSSSSEMSNDESEYEKKYAKTSERKKIKTKFKKQPEIKKSLDASRRDSSSLHKASQALNVSKKRKPCFVENHSTKRIKSNRGREKSSDLNDNTDLTLQSSVGASDKKVDIRRKEVPRHKRDESAFFVEKNSFCSKYWTPDYNEFETGEVQENLKSNNFKKAKQTAGRILLTDPKPMEYRSRKFRGREEWFREQSSDSCQNSDQNERISENTNEKSSYTAKNSSKSSLNQRLVSSKEYSSAVDQKFSTELPSNQVIASSKGNTLVGSRKISTELFSSKTFAASKEHNSIVNPKFSKEPCSIQTTTSSRGKNTSVSSRKIPTKHISNKPIASSRTIATVASRKNSIELFSDESTLSSKEFNRNFSTELPSSQTIASSKENSSVANQINPTEQIYNRSVASSRTSTSSVGSRKNSIELFSDETLLASKEFTSIVNRDFSSELPSSQTISTLKENASVSNRKIPTEQISNKPVASSRTNISSANRNDFIELSLDEALLASKEYISIVNRKFSTELPSSKASTSSKGNTSVAGQKMSTEQICIQPVVSSRANTSLPNQKKSSDLFSDEALLASSGNLPFVQQKNPIEVISSAVITSLNGNPFPENLEQSMLDKGDNSAMIKSTVGTIRMNTSPSIPRRRNSSGCRTRFLVEIQRNEDEPSKNKGLIEKETLPQPLEKGDCNSPVMVKTTENGKTLASPTPEETKKERIRSEITNKIVANISLNREIAPLLSSLFEDRKQMVCREQKVIGGNELSTSKLSDTTSEEEPKPMKLNAKTNDAQISAKDLLERLFSSAFGNKTQMNSVKQKGTEENELSTYKLPDTTSKIEPNLTKTMAKLSDAQFLPKEVFSKNDKISNDKKVAIVSPVSHGILSQPESAPYLQAPIKEKITNRVHSTYILSPPKLNSKPIQSNSDCTSVDDAADSSLDAKFCSRSLIKSILQWNPKWLEEQAKNKKPPPLVSKGGLVLPLRYSSYDSYQKSFYPMISLEIWECLFRKSKPIWLKKEVKNSFYYTVRSNKIQHGFMELHCESVVNENLSFLPYEGNVILLGFSDAGSGLENSLFGYIHCHKVESALEAEKAKDWQEVPKEWQENAKIWTFSVYIKKSKKTFLTESVSLAYGILNIKNKLQLADALVCFKDSPIQNDILRPTKEMFTFCKSISKVPRTQLIQTVSEEVKKENPHSKLILINAPVATGKTGAIIGIVEKLLFSKASKMKLLLCALSDMTVDEIGLRLVELNERCSWRGNCIKFVRFGQSENIPAKLQAYTLETNVQRMFKEKNRKLFEEREKELKVLEDKINNVLFKERLKTNDKYRFRKSNDEALKQLTDQLQSLKDRSPYNNIDPVIQATYESSILNESDMVLATLNNCMHPLMKKFFMSCKDESPACCIIDEISQCTELEVLQCLHPKINRLVLVGDLQQLQPHVSSKYAINWGFKRSMLERISKLFSVQFSCAPPLSLIEQHRMHSQISHFSSKYFYKGELMTASGIDDRYNYSPLKPFVVYDILEREMPNPPVNIEDNEPFIIANICAQLLQAVPTASLGVIVPHEDLAALYRIPLSLGTPELKLIEVNTVENYQGIEKDIIIISCVNPSLFAESDSFLSCEKRMNVAMTRARQSLVICGHISSLMQFEHWAALINDTKIRKNFISVSSLRQIPFVIMKTICRIS